MYFCYSKFHQMFSNLLCIIIYIIRRVTCVDHLDAHILNQLSACTKMFQDDLILDIFNDYNSSKTIIMVKRKKII